MNHARRPEIFISATSADLRSCRELIKQALLTLGCVPIEQTNFPPDYRTVREMLRTKIAACDAVIHLAGDVYGAEPQSRAPDEPRRSYTQMEYDLARELKKPLYLFVCGEDFPYDQHTPEDAEKHGLQQIHREAVATGETLRYKVHTRDELALKVRELQTAVEQLGEDLRQARSWLGRGVAIGLICLALLGGGLWRLKQRTDVHSAMARTQAEQVERTESRVSVLETELEKQRRYLKSVAGAFTDLQAQLRKLQLDDAAIYNRAVAAVAAREGLPTEELRAGIDLFVAAVMADPKSASLDRALSDFANRNFKAAAVSAGQAAQAARRKRLAAQALKAETEKAETEAMAQEGEAFKIQGQALLATQAYPEAVDAFNAALEVVPNGSTSRLRARLEYDLGSALMQWSSTLESAGIDALQTRALDAFNAARSHVNPADDAELWARSTMGVASIWTLQAKRASGPKSVALNSQAIELIHQVQSELPQEKFPQESAYTNLFLAELLLGRANFLVGPELIATLSEARQAIEGSLRVYAKDPTSVDWAFAQLSLAGVKGTLADAKAPDALKLRRESEQGMLAALSIFNRIDYPKVWAATQRNLANSHWRAVSTPGVDNKEELGQAAKHAQAALEVYTREQHPLQWAETLNTLGIILRQQAQLSSPDKAKALLADSIDIYRQSLEVYDRERFPQNWAQVQNNLGRTLVDATSFADPTEVPALLDSAIAIYREALQIRTREHFPKYWTITQRNLANALLARAASLKGKSAVDAYFESLFARAPLLEFYKESNLTTNWAETQADISYAYMKVASWMEHPRNFVILRLSADAMWLALDNLSNQAGTTWFETRNTWLQKTEAKLESAGLPRKNNEDSAKSPLTNSRDPNS